MKCSRCNSENIQMQTQKGKGMPTIAFVMIFGGFGLMFLGIIGLVIGAFLGGLIGGFAKAGASNRYETVAVCQDCGFTSGPVQQGLPSQNGHPLLSTESECNLSITRENSFIGCAISLIVRIDNYKPLNISDGMTVHLKLAAGQHRIVYEQGGGLGKKSRRGFVDVITEDSSKRHMSFTFTKTGLDMVKSW